MSRYWRGHVYEAFSAFHVQYYQTELRGGQHIRDNDTEIPQEGHRARGVQERNKAPGTVDREEVT